LKDPASQEWQGPEGAFSVLGVGMDKEELSQQTFSYRTRDWRYVLYRGGQEELYDQRNDPFEWKNLASDPAFADQKQQMRDQMMAIVHLE